MTRRDLLFVGTAAACVALAWTPLVASPLATRWLRGYRIGRISRFLTPGYSCCLRCFTTWAFVESHVTYFISCDGDGDWGRAKDGKGVAESGVFVLCNQCWDDMGSPESRLPFYRAWFDERESRWPEIAYADSALAWSVWKRSVMLDHGDFDPMKPRTFIDGSGKSVTVVSTWQTEPADPGPFGTCRSGS